jgi:DNA-binding protein HU-beta
MKTTVTKQEFVDQIASKTDLSREEAARAVDAFLKTVAETLKNGQDVTFTGFGKFSTQRRAARRGDANPRETGEKITIPAATVPKFSASRALTAAVAGGRSASRSRPDPLDEEPDEELDREARAARLEEEAESLRREADEIERRHREFRTRAESRLAALGEIAG